MKKIWKKNKENRKEPKNIAEQKRTNLKQGKHERKGKNIKVKGE